MSKLGEVMSKLGMRKMLTLDKVYNAVVLALEPELELGELEGVAPDTETEMMANRVILRLYGVDFSDE